MGQRGLKMGCECWFEGLKWSGNNNGASHLGPPETPVGPFSAAASGPPPPLSCLDLSDGHFFTFVSVRSWCPPHPPSCRCLAVASTPASMKAGGTG